MKKIDIASVRLGSDAEVFLIDRTGRPFPACGIIGGTKEAPLKLSDDGCAVQEDNVMLEFNTPISANSDEWVRNLSRAMELAFAKIPPTMYPSFDAVQRFAPELLANPQANTFGCEPDFCAWTNEQNPRPRPQDPTMRTAAGHVHISWDEPEDMLQRCRVIQMADIFVSLPSLSESKDRERRLMYGKAGAFRPKSYGVEHRVLDNYWLENNDYLYAVYDRYMEAIEAANSDFEISDKLAACVQEVINNYDVGAAVGLRQEVADKVFPRVPLTEIQVANYPRKAIKTGTYHAT